MLSEDKQRLTEIGARIDAMSREFALLGVTHPAEREALAEYRLQELAREQIDTVPVRKVVATNFEILRLTIARLLARIDKGF